MSRNTKEALLFIAMIWLIFNTGAALWGLMESRIGYRQSDCKKPIMRYEVLLPGFTVGCWLGEEL